MDRKVSETHIPVDSSLNINVGWLVAVGTGLWGWMLRIVLGRHLKSVDRIEGKIDDLIERVAKLEGINEGSRK